VVSLRKISVSLLFSSFHRLSGSSSTVPNLLVLRNNFATMSYPVCGDADIMSQKAHGTCEHPVMNDLRFGCDKQMADRVCCFNRHYAENAGYWKQTNFLKEVNKDGETMFFDSVSGKPLFIAPRGRTFEQFRRETDSHGWPSFRDQEVVWDNVRVIRGDNEAVSVDGTHLGHNIPDSKGNRYCINLVSIAGAVDPASVDVSSLSMASGEAGFTEESCGAGSGKSSSAKSCSIS